MSVDISQLLSLSPTEKLEIIGELWESIGDGHLPLPQWQIDEIERRAAEHQKNPDAASSWKEIKARFSKVC